MLCTTIAMFVCLSVGHAGSVQPNIVVILGDDMGWNDVGYHGSNEIPTPNLDALAYSGIMLERHYVGPTCTPSRSAFYTGKYPFHLGMQGDPIGAGQEFGIPLSETLMPQHLRNLGYATHLVGKWHVGHYTTRHTPTYRGYDTFFGYYHGYLGYYDGLHTPGSKSKMGPGSGMDAHRNLDDAWQEFVGRYATDVFTKEAVDIIKAHNTSKPLYLQVMHLGAHTGNEGQKMEVRDTIETLKKYDYIEDYNRRLYAGMMEAVDDSVGQIVASLKDAGLLENSIVVFMSDNGAPTLDPKWDTNNHGSNWPLRGQKISAHEGGVHVPAIVYSPMLSNNISTELFHITDWLPTLYKAAGGKVSDLGKIDGIDQWEALKTSQKAEAPEGSYPRTQIVVEMDDTFQQEALIHGHWKIIKHGANNSVDFAHVYAGSSGRNRTYPAYNLTAVITSPAHRAIHTQQPDLKLYHYKRSQGTIDDKCQLIVDGQTSTPTPCYDFCLYNLHIDPCETTDLASTHPDILENLVGMMKEERKHFVPRRNYPYDLKAHPKLWDNRWVSWMDPQYQVVASATSGYENNAVIMFVLLVIGYAFH